MTKPTCTVNECERLNHSGGYCKVHYTRWKRHGDPLTRLRKESVPTGKGPCAVEGCDKEQKVRGWCPMHYQRQRQFGSLESPRPSLLERFNEKVRKTDSCWLWEAATDGKGYGQMMMTVDGHSRLHQAHRISYELFVGPIPDGKYLDHRCHVINCVNPDHLRPVTQKENLEHRSGAARHSKSGIRGVSWSEKSGKWRAAIRHNQKNVHVGHYSTAEEADAAVTAKRNELFTHNDMDRPAA